MRVAGYNPRQRMISYRRPLLLMLALVFLVPARALTSWEGPLDELAKQIAAIAGPGPAKLTIKNRSSLPVEQVPAIRRTLERDLQSYGVTASSSAEVATVIRVTLSENLQHELWIAEVQEGTEVKVVMVSTDPLSTATPSSDAVVTLRKTLLLTQEMPILDVDFVSVGNERRMVVLERERVVAYRQNNGTWVQDQSFDIVHSRPIPRDPRGRIVLGTSPGHLFDAYIPGVVCSGSESSGRLVLSCNDSDDPWPMVSRKAIYSAARNYFTGVLVPGFATPPRPFYNAAEYARSGGTVTLFSETTGQVVLYDKGIPRTVTGTRDWGSDIASIQSTCSEGSLLLVSAAGTAPTDSVRAYEIPGKEAIPVSGPMPLDGSVMAMWQANDSATATIVIRKRQPVQYEAYNVSAVCN
jgi:type II secretory pathway component PulM